MAEEEEGAPPEEPEGGVQGERELEAQDEAGDQRYTIRRLLVKPGKCLTEPRDENLANRLPVLPQEAKAYTPMPYIFRVPTTSTPTKILNLLARSPPFHLLLDHTIAVVWLLFAKGEYDCPLGINQLQWTLAFLKTIQCRTGDYAKDVAVCIEAIENIMLVNYAKLNEEINVATRLDQTVHYGGGALGSSTMVTQQIPISINYSQMITKNPKGAYLSGKIQPLSMTSLECEEALENLKKAAGVDSIENLDSVSKDKAINVLRMWKTDQVEKIRGELKRLRSIEDKMRDIDDNFHGYLEDEPDALLGSD